MARKFGCAATGITLSPVQACRCLSTCCLGCAVPPATRHLLLSSLQATKPPDPAVMQAARANALADRQGLADRVNFQVHSLLLCPCCSGSQQRCPCTACALSCFLGRNRHQATLAPRRAPEQACSSARRWPTRCSSRSATGALTSSGALRAASTCRTSSALWASWSGCARPAAASSL